MGMKRTVLLLAVPIASCFVQPYAPGAGGLCVRAVASPLRPRHTSRLQAEGDAGGGLFAGLFGKNKKPVTQEGETEDKKPVKSEPKRTIGGGMCVYVLACAPVSHDQFCPRRKMGR